MAAKTDMPQPGERYTARGYTFRVDAVRDGFVHYARWRTGGDRSKAALCRSTYREWRKAASELKLMNRKAKESR